MHLVRISYIRNVNIHKYWITFKKISLRSLNDNAMREKEQSHLMGGQECSCACTGPSSTSSNMSFNYASGYDPAHSCNFIEYDGTNMGVVCRPHA